MALCKLLLVHPRMVQLPGCMYILAHDQKTPNQHSTYCKRGRPTASFLQKHCTTMRVTIITCHSCLVLSLSSSTTSSWSVYNHRGGHLVSFCTWGGAGWSLQLQCYNIWISGLLNSSWRCSNLIASALEFTLVKCETIGPVHTKWNIQSKRSTLSLLYAVRGYHLYHKVW